nr:hypothetical protein B0A51_05755 [Rachicladosporium sp. CCFEE 5018]OQO26321.1 hypothetical protein B0A51_05172 [Rachicladosporium sp. CCFEE 5018]OQO26809.1 hypothetical protein B0A51_04392 [Rachicladosporium sp. CCFEE 5018]
MSSTTPAPLQLFPSPSLHGMPRKSSLKKPKTPEPSLAQANDLRGVAWSVTMQSGRAARVQPANAQVKHIGSPRIPTSEIIPISNKGSPQRQLRTRRRSSAPSLAQLQANPEAMIEEDQLSPLPINTSFSPSSPPRIRTPVAPARRPAQLDVVPRAAVPVQESHVDDDQLSPLPSKQHFAPAELLKPEYPNSSGPKRSKSDASARPAVRIPSPPPNRSIFPQYNHDRPLAQQQYFPPPANATHAAPVLARIPQTGGKAMTTTTTPWTDSAVVLPDFTQQLPRASKPDAFAIWYASTTTSPPAGRKVCLDLAQPAGSAMSLVLGIEGHSLYSMTATNAPSAGKTPALKQVSVQKACPETDIASPVAQLHLPTTPPTISDEPLTSVFPHQAAVDAIHFVANTPTACEIAHFDPTGISEEASRLAKDAVADAHRRYTCQLSRLTRRRDSFSILTASYILQHPMLGPLIITVKKSTSPSTPRDPKAKISLHHPSATEAAIAAENLVLLSLDFASDTCTIDTPGLMALDEPYMIDTAISAVFAAAVLENDFVVKDTLTFEPPPKTPTVLPGTPGKLRRKLSTKTTKSVKKGRWYRRTKVVEIDEGSGELAGVARGVLAVVGLGLRGVVWVVGAGFRAGRSAVR